MFVPLNGHVEIEPIEQESVVYSQETNFEEKGKVLSTSFWAVAKGDIVYFDSWMAAKYPDSEGKVRYLVPGTAIRAKECDVDVTAAAMNPTATSPSLSKSDFPPLT